MWVLVAKAGIENTATYRAQGGVAAVSSKDDSLQQHIDDTLAVGCGLNRMNAVETACREGPRRIQKLIDQGLLFDRGTAGIALGLERGA